MSSSSSLKQPLEKQPIAFLCSCWYSLAERSQESLKISSWKGYFPIWPGRFDPACMLACPTQLPHVPASRIHRRILLLHPILIPVPESPNFNMFITCELKGHHASWFFSRSKYLQGRVHNTPYAMCASFHVCTWIPWHVWLYLLTFLYIIYIYICICSCLSVWTLSCLIAVCKCSMLYVCKWLAVLACLHIRHTIELHLLGVQPWCQE